MSKLNDLINKFCPHGVKYVRLGDVCKITSGKFVNKSKQTKNGHYPVYNAGTGPTGFYDDYNTDSDKIIISAQGAAGFVNHIREKFWAGNSCHVLNIFDNNLLTRYLYFILLKMAPLIISKRTKGITLSVTKSSLEILKIPLPPLPVQEEIVKILDKFTDLENELENELRMRKMQFNAYRDKLLTFDNGVRFEKLGDVCLLNRYKQLSAEKLKSLKTNNGDIHLLPSSRNFDWITTKQLAGNFVCHGEVFTIGRANVANPKYVDGYFISSNNIIIESKNKQKLSTKYLYYFVISNEKHIYIETPTYPKFDASSFNTLTIPVPPLEKQKEIVEKLDKFNEMCNEISDGLPLEIELRKKQYEFCRDRLLSFDKKAS